MAKPKTQDSSGCLLLGIALFFGPIGLLMVGSEIFGLITGSSGHGPNYSILGFGVFFIIVAALTFKESLQSRESQSLSLNPINPMNPMNPIERTTYAKSEQEKEIARQDAAEASKVASQFSPLDRKLLEEVRADMHAAPSQDEVIRILKAKNPGEITLANTSLQLVSFAIKPTSVLNYVKGIAFEILTWIFVVIRLWFRLVRPSSIAWGNREEGVLYQGLRMRRAAQRYRLRLDKALKRDGRTPILYLRSFSSDYEDNPENYLPKTSEEKLVNYYKRYGPVIAIGKSGDELPLLGAGRIHFDDSTWSAAVLYLMSISQFVIIEAGFARGLLWELGMARQRIEPRKLIISFIGLETLDEWQQHLHYLRFRKYAEELLECKLPPNIRPARFISFESGWEYKRINIQLG